MTGPTAYLDPTECAWRTPLGHDVATVIARMDDSFCAYEPLGLPGYSIAQCARIAGEPPVSRYRRFVKRMGLWGIEAAGEAIERAGLQPADRTGVYVGYGGLRPDWDETLPRLEHQSDDGDLSWDGGLKDFHPFWMLNHLSNNAHSIVATRFGLTGDGATYGGTNSGIVAVEAAIDALALGVIDVAVVFAYDTLIQPEVLVEWPLDDATAAWVPGEAAVAIVLRAEPRAMRVSATSGADGASKPLTNDEFTAAIGRTGAADGLLRLVAAAHRGVPMTFNHHCAPGLVATIECAP